MCDRWKSPELKDIVVYFNLALIILVFYISYDKILHRVLAQIQTDKKYTTCVIV